MDFGPTAIFQVWENVEILTLVYVPASKVAFFKLCCGQKWTQTFICFWEKVQGDAGRVIREVAPLTYDDLIMLV